MIYVNMYKGCLPLHWFFIAKLKFDFTDIRQ